jgi:hypothetical protein
MTTFANLTNERLLELFFSQSLDGFFFMMLDEPVEWSDQVDKERVLDYVFTHQRMTKLNPAIATQFQAVSPDQLLGMTVGPILHPRHSAGAAAVAGVFRPGPDAYRNR